jgi:hypothetical protein
MDDNLGTHYVEWHYDDIVIGNHTYEYCELSRTQALKLYEWLQKELFEQGDTEHGNSNQQTDPTSTRSEASQR